MVRLPIFELRLRRPAAPRVSVVSPSATNVQTYSSFKLDLQGVGGLPADSLASVRVM